MYEAQVLPEVAVSPQVIVKLCDGTTDIKQFPNTQFSRLSAREYFHEMCEKAGDTQIANQPPHVINVQFHDGINVNLASVDYMCRCRRETPIPGLTS